MIFFSRPISAGLMSVAIAFLAYNLLASYRRKRARDRAGTTAAA
jgi:TctA family transporter